MLNKVMWSTDLIKTYVSEAPKSTCESGCSLHPADERPKGYGRACSRQSKKGGGGGGHRQRITVPAAGRVGRGFRSADHHEAAGATAAAPCPPSTPWLLLVGPADRGLELAARPARTPKQRRGLLAPTI